ncbi:MAG: hypothetical protein CMD08_01580 [Flavobacteriales bacterium]|nr:hypothetical protein [Flavobacteriales bacterium]|tara:strand:+ start:335 stop:610 length:276 start_codon:yes stop_codon:yes gene_type:complete
MSSSTNDFYLKPGDMIWVELKGADQNYGHGEVVEVWFEKSVNEECFNFYCLVNGGYRMGRLSKLIKKPNARMMSKLLQSRREYNEIMKERR